MDCLVPQPAVDDPGPSHLVSLPYITMTMGLCINAFMVGFDFEGWIIVKVLKGGGEYHG